MWITGVFTNVVVTCDVNADTIIDITGIMINSAICNISGSDLVSPRNDPEPGEAGRSTVWTCQLGCSRVKIPRQHGWKTLVKAILESWEGGIG